MWIIAGLISAFVAFFVNRRTSKLFKRNAIIYITPFSEEILKTIFAIELGTNIIYSHTIFGVAEGVYDYLNGDKQVNLRAAILSIITHTLFGIITAALKIYLGIWIAVMITALIHSLWNYIMLGGIKFAN